MNSLEALIFGLVQGLTEYLPVSSSGHLTICSNLFGLNGADNLTLNIVVHVATVLSTCVILWKEIVWLFKDLFKWEWNEGTKYILNILISMLPVGFVGLLFKDKVEAIFGSGLTVVGICLLVTAALLAFAYYAKPKLKEHITPGNAFLIGVAQAIAVLPGLSRSGSTIATGLLLGNKKESMAQFSFLMVIPPILGEALLEFKDIVGSASSAVTQTAVSTSALVIAFLAAFISGCLACKWMINIVKKGKLIWFALYCVIVGVLALTVLQ